MTQPKFKVKRGDLVEVMTGQSKGSRGAVERVLLQEGRVIVTGVRTVMRHIRPNAQCLEGKVLRTLSIHVSNVAVFDPTTNAPGRVEYRIDASGEKKRFFKGTDTVVGAR
ncbi:MAG: 50S ribosomal protein L24 [Holosporales bacterium]|jgi:large subunit ribosomal protein L24|nr:50S ribosomal protein L24 [Holosporales bacterium]